MPSELKADLDGEFLTVIAEQPNDILKCAMYLFLGYLDGASQFAQSCGGEGTSSDLPWGRNPDDWAPFRLPLHDAGPQDAETNSAQTRHERKTLNLFTIGSQILIEIV